MRLDGQIWDPSFCPLGYNSNRKRDAIILMLILKAECLNSPEMKKPGVRFEVNVRQSFRSCSRPLPTSL